MSAPSLPSALRPPAPARPANADPVAAEMPARLRLVVMRLGRLLRHADASSTLSQTLISALATVSRCGPITLGHLADAERVQPPSMTRIVDQLEERGLVARHVDPDDRRIVRVGPTPAAAAVLAEVRTRHNEYLAARLTGLTAAELAALHRALPALERLIDVGP